MGEASGEGTGPDRQGGSGGAECAACGTRNPPGARFCMGCGAALERRCAACGTPAPPAARFCMACGTALAAPAAGPARAAGAAGEPPPEERRRVTVLFADLSGYTAIAERLDPEQVKALVDRCLRRLGDEVTRFGGTVDKYIGDNVMAIFGAPVAHEDDPERAVRAALAMRAAMAEINAELEAERDLSFALRVGLNSGEVVAGSPGGGREGYTVMGDVVNVAARLQAAGRPDSITVGELTVRATRHAVRYRELEPLVLKGKAEPVPAWEVEGLAAAAPQGRAVHSEARLVGRRAELELLAGHLKHAMETGRAQLMTVFGEAGVGKSRLLSEFEAATAAAVAGPHVTFRKGRCVPYGSGFGFHALGEVVSVEFGILDSDSAEVAWQKLLAGSTMLFDVVIGRTGDAAEREPPERRAAMLGRLLGIEVPAGVAPAEASDPQRLREGFFSAVRAGFEAMTWRGPLVVAFEDIHWADEGMLELIEYLARWVRGPLLIVCLAREELLERRPGWGRRRGAASVFLDPLPADETRELVSALLPEGAGGELVRLVTDRAEGNPLFAEEMVRRLVEEGLPSGGRGVALPETVHAVLAARLDALDPFERTLAQQASVVGRVFWEGALAGVADGRAEDVGAALRRLQEKEIIVPGQGQALGGEPEYSFKHVLIRDVAYSTLPKAVRWRKHHEVGRFIEERSGDRTDEVVALLAQHFSRAVALGEEVGAPAAEVDEFRPKAVGYLVAAGDRAAALYSNREALAHYDEALQRGAPAEDGTRARVLEAKGEIALRLGQADVAIEAWEECLDYHREQEDLPRVGDLLRKIGSGFWNKGERKTAIEHYQKGINLLKGGPPSIELVRLYEEAASLYMHTGDNILAIYASEKALRLAERLGEARAASRAHGIFGRVFGRIGDPEKARENLERSVELARESDPGETIRALLTLGYHLETSAADYDGAEAAYREGLELAQRVGDLPAQVELWAARAQIAGHRADWDEFDRATEASTALAEREGLVGKLCFPYVMRGLMQWREGDWEAAERTYEQARELAEQVGWSEVAFSALYGLGVVRRDRGSYAEAGDALGLALDVCERAGLIAQSIQAMSARAVTLAAAHKMDQAREAAEEAVRLAGRLHYPVGTASAHEADGLVRAASGDVEHGRARLEEARAAWRELGRPLDAARCDLLLGRALCKQDEAEAREHLEAARAEFERLRVPHLARLASEAETALH